MKIKVISYAYGVCRRRGTSNLFLSFFPMYSFYIFPFLSYKKYFYNYLSEKLVYRIKSDCIRKVEYRKSNERFTVRMSFRIRHKNKSKMI